MDCLDDDLVYRLVRGELAPPALVGADEHLDSCGDCRALVALVARGSGEGEEVVGPGLERGAVIGRYVVGDEVGGGAMGVVYAAWDPELDRRVALKVLREGGDARREAQAMARLAHPNVVTVHEVGVVDGRVFVAMELVAGKTLRAWMQEGRAWPEVCEVMLQVGRGLAAAHAAAVVHRDVKPDNVIVGEDGRARVGDFGLARGQPGTGTGTGTGTGIAGTPAYMAPEVLRGGVADARADQFSYAVTFFEALHGVRPGKATPRRRVPGWLDAIVRRGLAARPEDRFPSVDAMVDAIVARRQVRRWRWAGAATAAAAASLATWILVRGAAPAAAPGPSCDLGAAEIAAVWGGDARGRVERGLAAVGTTYAGDTAARAVTAIDAWAAEWARAEDAVCAATQAPDEHATRSRCLDRRRDELAALIERLAAADREVALRAVDAIAALPSPAECAVVAAGSGDPLPADPEARAHVDAVAGALATIHAANAVGDWRRARDDAARLVPDAVAAAHQPTLAEVHLAHAAALRLGGDHAAAEEAGLESLWAAERGHDDAGVARAWIELAELAGERRDLAAADERARHAEAALARAGDPAPLVAALESLRGLIAYNRGRLDEAEALFTAALARDGADLAAVRSSLGSVARARGLLDEALAHQQAAFALDRERLGEAHPAVARDLHNIAGVLRLEGDLAGALARYREALAIERAALGDAHAATGLTRNSIGLVLMAQDQLDDAEVEIAAARDILEAAAHGERAIAHHNLGLIAQRRGDHRAALRHYDAALAIYRATIGEDAEAPVRLLLDRAVSERATGRRDEAIRNAKAAKAGAAKLAASGARAVEKDAAEVIEDKEPDAARKPEKPSRDVGVYGSGQPW